MTPFRINFVAIGPTMDEIRANAEANAHRPRVQFCAPTSRRLAIVGGGPSAERELETLRTWDGDIWAINYTAQWLTEKGIDCTLFTVDVGDMDVRAPRAILSSYCHPAMFDRMPALAFDPLKDGDQIIGGATSATTAPWLSLRLGYTDVTFFGCEGSFADRDHVDRDDNLPHQLIVKANGGLYRTRPDYLIQCHELARLFRNFGALYSEQSGGLVRAMTHDLDGWEVVGVSAALKEHLEEVNGREGRYEQPFAA